MDASYDTDTWAARTTLGRRVFNIRFRVRASALEGWQLIKAVPMETARSDSELAYLLERVSEPGRALIRVGTAEAPNWRAAQARLREELDAMMRPSIPPGTKRLASLGDVNFVGRDPATDAAAGVSFTRGNVCVTVRSVGERSIDVSDLALWLDRELGEPPDERDIDRGHFERAVIEPRPAGRAAREVLIRDLERDVPAGSWLKVIAADGELSRVGDQLIYSVPTAGIRRIETFVSRIRHDDIRG